MANTYKLLATILVTLAIVQKSSQDVKDNEVDSGDERNPLADAAAAILKEQNAENIGGMVNNLLQSGAGKQIGDMLLNAATSENAGPMLQGLSSLLGQAGQGQARPGAGPNIGDLLLNLATSENAGPILQGIGSLLGQAGQGQAQPAAGANIADMLLNVATSENAAPILQGIGSLLGQAGQGQGGAGGLDPNLLAAAMNLMSASQGGKPGSSLSEPKKKGDDAIDMNSILSLAGSFLNQPGNTKGLMDMLPMAMQTLNSFMGPEADERAKTHKDHSWLMPPILEKVHVMFDHFVHSDMGKQLITTLGAEKFVKIFQDESGKLSYDKFVEMMENHSFRRHWIKMVTSRIALILSYFSDPNIQQQYLSSAQHFINSVLKRYGYPKSAMFDPSRPVETISAFANYLIKTNFQMKVNSKQYVKPAVEYVQELFRLAQSKGLLTSVDSRQLSDKLTDTINLEIIEPIARVNRAYRFAKKVPQCDRYVMCLVNQEDSNDVSSLPGLKALLSKGSSMVLSWFLSGHTGTSFWSLYNVITEQDSNCKARFLEACHDFHIEEIKVTTEYVHNEL